MTKNDYPILLPKSGHAKKLVMFLHGVGSSGDDLISLAPYLQNEFPDIYFASPHGVEDYEYAPNARQWFSLNDRELVVLQRELTRVSPSVLAIIENKMKSLDLTWQDVILVGFSQGAMLALYLTLMQSQRFNAVVAFSGSLIAPSILPEYLNKTPVCLIHGTKDEVVLHENMLIAKKKLDSLNFEVDSHSLDDIGHTIDAKGLELLVNFIKKSI